MSQVGCPASAALRKQHGPRTADLHTATLKEMQGRKENMQRIFVRLAMAVTITAIGMFGADNSLGTWKRNVAKSKSTPPSTIKSVTLVNEASDGGVKQADGFGRND